MTFTYNFDAVIHGRYMEWYWEYEPSEIELCRALIDIFQRDTRVDLKSMTEEAIAIAVWSHFEEPYYKGEMKKEYGSVDKCIEEAKVYLASSSKYHRPEKIDRESLLRYLLGDVDYIAEKISDDLKAYFEDAAENDWRHNREYD